MQEAREQASAGGGRRGASAACARQVTLSSVGGCGAPRAPGHAAGACSGSQTRRQAPRRRQLRAAGGARRAWQVSANGFAKRSAAHSLWLPRRATPRRGKRTLDAWRSSLDGGALAGRSGGLRRRLQARTGEASACETAQRRGRTCAGASGARAGGATSASSAGAGPAPKTDLRAAASAPAGLGLSLRRRRAAAASAHTPRRARTCDVETWRRRAGQPDAA